MKARPPIIPKQWGMKLEGCEPVFAKILHQAANHCKDEVFQYMEMGVGNCRTMLAVAQVLQSMEVQAQVTGFDLPGCVFGSDQTFKDVMAGFIPEGHVQARMIRADARQVLDHFEPDSLHVIFIDCCHCYECVTRDFLAAEVLLKEDGVAIFHDAGMGCQHINPQTFHENRPIAVRRALSDLGLFACDRQGWMIVVDMHNIPFGIAAFSKIKDPRTLAPIKIPAPPEWVFDALPDTDKCSYIGTK